MSIFSMWYVNWLWWVDLGDLCGNFVAIFKLLMESYHECPLVGNQGEVDKISLCEISIK